MNIVVEDSDDIISMMVIHINSHTVSANATTMCVHWDYKYTVNVNMRHSLYSMLVN